MSNIAVNDAGDVLTFDGKAWKPASIAENDAGERVVLVGAEWQPLGQITGKAKGSTPNNAVDATGNAFAQGATLGYGDELTAAVRSAAPGFANWMMRGPALQRDPSIGGDPNAQPQTVSTAPTFSGRYEEELARQRAQNASDQQAHPYLTTGANIAGNVATTALALPAAATSVGPSLVGNIAKTGAVGGTLGAAQGFGEGEGGFQNRLMPAAVGGAVGGVLGAAMPIVGMGARRLAESSLGRWTGENVVAPVARALSGNRPVSLSAPAADGGPPPGSWAGELADRTRNVAQTGATERLATALQRSKMDTGAVQRRLGQLGDDAMIADVDPQFLSMARMAHTMPGETRSLAKTALEGRDRQAGNRLVRAFEGGESPPSSFRALQGMDANRSAVGADVYGTMRGDKLKISGEMQRLQQVPAVRDAIAQIQADATATGTQLSPIEIAHRVKQRLNDIADAAFASGKPINKADLRDLGSAWEAAFWQANPSARAADTAYAQAASLPDYFQAGRKFLSRGGSDVATDVSAPGLADTLANANVQQQTAARIGATNAARETALEGTKPTRALASRVDESALVREKLVQLYGPARADRIIAQAGAEKTFAETSNDILRGTKSADKIAEVLDTGNAAIRIGESGISARVLEYIDNLVNRLGAPNEAVRNEMGRMMLNTNPAEQERILRLAEMLMRRRAEGAPVRAGLIEATAGAASREVK